ncbi:MAG: sensor histidine kinase [Chloroflexota bacterium]
MTKEKLDFPEQIDMGEFISKEAHDLRSPFNRILGFTKMILKGMDGPLTDMQREDLDTVFANSNHALRLINNLIDMARLSRGEKPFAPTGFEAQALINQAVANWQKAGSEKTVTFETRVSPPELSLPADETLLRQAIEVFAHYLVEYTESPLTVSIQAEERDGRAEFSLTSQGTKNRAASACDMTMWAYVGRKIVELHGGELLESEGDDSGASIRFAVPAA